MIKCALKMIFMGVINRRYINLYCSRVLYSMSNNAKINMYQKLLHFFFISIFLLFQQCSSTRECVPRNYGHGSVVCVCNSTYCDTIEDYDKQPSGIYIIYTSSKEGLRLKKSTGKFEQKRYNRPDETITLNLELKYQTVLGWGGAFTDAAGYNIRNLNVAAQNHLLRSYFAKEGIEYSLCRVPIGCSDLSLNYYSYDDVPNDVDLKHFNITKEDYEYKLPFMKSALAMSNNSLKFFGSSWAPPLWMKTNNQPSGLGYLKREYYQTWANYHIKFLDAYKKEGIDYWGLTTGNEPILGLTPFFQITSVGWYPWDQGKWIAENLGPAIRNNPKYKEVKIIAFDDERLILPWWMIAETIGNNASSYIDGIGIHWYTDPWFPALLTMTHMLFPDKFILGTEACAGDQRYRVKVALGSWHRGEQYVDDIIEDMDHWVTGWVDWNIALNLRGGPSYIQNFVDASIIINETAQEFYKNPTYYTMGHFSKFVPPGSVKIWVDIEGRSIKCVAFVRPDKGVAVIVFNRHDKKKRVTISDKKTGYINIEMPQRSVSTILFWP